MGCGLLTTGSKDDALCCTKVIENFKICSGYVISNNCRGIYSKLVLILRQEMP